MPPSPPPLPLLVHRASTMSDAATLVELPEPNMAAPRTSSTGGITTAAAAAVATENFHNNIRAVSAGPQATASSPGFLLPSGMMVGRISSEGSAGVPSTGGGVAPPFVPSNLETFLPPDVTVVEEDGLNFNNVVKIFVTRQRPDYGNPWLTSGISTTTGSGVVIETAAGLAILTAAHVVADQTFLQVQRSGNHQDPNKYIAAVYAICHDCDLALLQVQSEHTDFWKDLEPAPIADIPSLRSVVLVAGFPVGGEQLSITEGVVSRIEGQTYSHSFRELLAITVDAAINAGNSGGPTFNVSGELVGIAFQVNFMANSNGHVVPAPLLRHFLDGVAKFGQDYQGVPMFGLETQELTNGNLRKHFGLDKRVHGILVTKVVHESSCYGYVQRHDVLTHIASRPIANNGTVIYQGRMRVKVPVVFQMNQCGGEVPLTIIRNGEEMTVNVVAKPDATLVARSKHDQAPTYFIYCGLVFQRLTMKFIDTQVPGFSHYERLVNNSKLMTPEWKQVCILSKVLSDQVNIGYEMLRLEQIEKVNDKNVPDFASLVQMIESTTDEPYIHLTTCCGESIILPSPANPEAKQANDRIMQHYQISVDRHM